MPEITPLPAHDPAPVGGIRQRVRHARTPAVLAVNAELVRLNPDLLAEAVSTASI